MASEARGKPNCAVVSCVRANLFLMVPRRQRQTLNGQISPWATTLQRKYGSAFSTTRDNRVRRWPEMDPVDFSALQAIDGCTRYFLSLTIFGRFPGAMESSFRTKNYCDVALPQDRSSSRSVYKGIVGI